MARLPIYLDNNATTPCDPRVVEEMLPYFTELFGNAASTGHSFGRTARVAVERARASVARSLNARAPGEIVFTSGATESDNLAIKGVAERCSDRGNHIISCVCEHKAVLDSCKHLESQGFEVTYLRVGTDGLVDLDMLANAITSRTILVTIMAGNNESGVVQDVASIGKMCRERGVCFHTDATQFIGKLPFDVQAMNVDLASLSAHKIYGPKGVGALYVRRDPSVWLTSLMDGGGNESGHRSGTLNVTGIVGLAAALRLCVEELPAEMAQIRFLRDRLLHGLQARLESVRLNGHPEKRLPGHLSLSFDGIIGEDLLAAVPEIAVSSISACSSGSASPSHVLTSLGLTEDQAFSTVRYGIGRFNTEDDIDYTVNRVAEAVTMIRSRVKPPALKLTRAD
jgi:cysteine desulfurase